MLSLLKVLPSMTTFNRRRTIIVCHLKPSPLVATFDIETLIRFRTIEDSLVAPNLFRHIIQRLYDVKAEVFPLLVFGNCDILDMTDQAEIMDATNVQQEPFILRLRRLVYIQFPLHDHSSRPHNLALPITNHQDMVLVLLLGHPTESLVPCLLRDVANVRQHAQHIEDAGFVVGALEGPDCVLGRKGGNDVGGDEGGGEERT